VSFITIHFVFFFCLGVINSGLKVLMQERFQPIVKLHVARRLSTGILGRHLAEGLATQPVIRAHPVVAIVPVSEHFQLLSFSLVAEAEVLV
jgi:hypothetical protein